MSYVLATTDKVVRWYSFNFCEEVNDKCFTLIDRLDLDRVPQAGSKETAKKWAIAMGLKTWRYVKL
ncbi:MAG TPA: hypothetical protein VIF37_02725 [Methylobacter sp.]|jgi:hypothetical protein